MNCEYVRDTYGVPTQIGRHVLVNNEPGIIAEDCGNYIGVNFDKDKPGEISNITQHGKPSIWEWARFEN